MINELNSVQLKELMDKGEEFTLVDCREADEVAQASIEGAIHIPLSNFAEGASVLNDKNKKIIIYCRSGRRSMNACQHLESQGYTDLTNVEDGILGWMDEGFDILD